jgi:hypothetical protein
MDRRAFLGLVGGVATGLVVLPLAACQEEPTVVPTEGWKLWIASRLHGRVVDGVSSFSLPDAVVVFRAGLEPTRLFELARTRSDSDGRFEIVASDYLSGSAGFFRIILPDQEHVDPGRDIPVYCQMDAGWGGRTGSLPFTLQRRPRKDLPNPIELERSAVVKS